MDRQTIWDDVESDWDGKVPDPDSVMRLWACGCGCVILIIVVLGIAGIVWLIIR